MITSPNQMTIAYSDELLWAMQMDADEFAATARELLAVKLYETGKLTTGLAADFLNVPRTTFLYILGKYKISPFAVTEEELAQDVANALRASHR